MKKIYLLLIALLSLGTVKAQIPVSQVDSLVNESRLMAKEIDNKIRYKTFLDRSGFHDEEINQNEWLIILYFDATGKLKKSKGMYGYTDASCNIYYDSLGVAAYTIYHSCSDSDGIYSIERYLDKDKKLLYVNQISKGMEQSPNSDELIEEKIVRRSSVVGPIPKIGDVLYDEILSIEDLNKISLDYFDPDRKFLGREISIPKQIKSIKFRIPKKGDITSLIQNEVPIYIKPSFESLRIAEINIRPNIEIVEVKGEWYKVATESCYSRRIEGYIHRDFLALIEQEIL